MKILLTIIFLCLVTDADAQTGTYIPFATGRAQDTAKTPGSLMFSGVLKAPFYANTDTTKVLSFNSAGKLVFVPKGTSGGATTTGADFITLTASAGTTISNAALANKTIAYIVSYDAVKSSGLAKTLSSSTLTLTDGSMFTVGQIVTIFYH